MEPYQRSDGVWMVPSVSYDRERDIRASGYRELTPDHPRYAEWTEWLEADRGWAGRVAERLPG